MQPDVNAATRVDAHMHIAQAERKKTVGVVGRERC
jgi:hypothetical protein